MNGQAQNLDGNASSGFQYAVKPSASRGRTSGLGKDAVAILQRVDIFGAVWSGAITTTIVARSPSSSVPASTIVLSNCLRHQKLGTIESPDLTMHLNIEQARTLFLCNLSFVQEKLRDGAARPGNLRVDIPVDAAALATLGSELRIIAQHTPDLFRRLEVTHTEDAIAALSPSQRDQLKEFAAFGLYLNVRGEIRAAQEKTGARSSAMTMDPSIFRGVPKFATHLAM